MKVARREYLIMKNNPSQDSNPRLLIQLTGNNIFSIPNITYISTKGLIMGKPLSPLQDELFMDLI